MEKYKKNLIWVAKIIVIIILFQTLPYKFGAKPESVELFTKLGVEPWGRILTGVLELVFGLMLVFMKTSKYGSLGIVLIMLGAILSHIFVLGFDALFILAVITLVLALFIYKSYK